MITGDPYRDPFVSCHHCLSSGTFLTNQSLQSLMSRFNVQGFPTILVFGADKDSPFPYEGARSASAIESFALDQLETNSAPPEVTELTSPVSSLSLSLCPTSLFLHSLVLVVNHGTSILSSNRTFWKRSVVQLPSAL